MTPALSVNESTRDFAVGTYGNTLLVHFRELTPAQCTAAFETGIRSIPKAEKVVFFGVIELASTPPDQEARQAFSRFFERHGDRLSALVITYRGEGFRAAMIRTVVSGIVSVLPRARFPFPRHVGASLDEASLAALKASPGLHTAGLLAAFESLSKTAPGVRAAR